MKRVYFFLTFLFSVFILNAESLTFPINQTWKTFDDNALIPTPPSVQDVPDGALDFLTPGYLKNTEEGGPFWLVCELDVPKDYETRELYFETGSTTAALEIYIDGILVETHGTIFPKMSINHVANTIVLIPQSAKEDGKISIAIRAKTSMSNPSFSKFMFSNDERYFKVVTMQNFLNTTVYFMMAAICLFLGFYFVCQLLGDKKEYSNFFFSLSLVPAAVYFFDMATDLLFLPINIQLSLSRFCLLCSVSALVVSIFSFFKRPIRKLVYTIIVVNSLFLIAFLIATTNSILLDTVFTLSLAPVFIFIIYLLVFLIKNVRKNDFYSKILLIGIAFGSCFAIHDLVYQVIGIIPFAWLQGFAFFLINLFMFIVISIETNKNKHSINIFAKTTANQKDILDDVMEKARQLSVETSSISNTLNESVENISKAIQDSVLKAEKIGQYMEIQNHAVANTSNAISNLVTSVNTVSEEIKTENSVVESTVGETKMMINGVSEVAVGIENAANFSSSLGQITKKTSEDINNLVSEIEAIKNSSEEIITIVKAVSDFSRRTNMLAMNASIEAAHSGVAGKGFSVIAHEIKKLAEASNNQSERISEIVTTINENISSGFELGLNVKNVMDRIAQDADTTSNSINESAISMEKQKSAGERIYEATALMSDSANTVKKETELQNDYAQIVSSSMSEVTTSTLNAEVAIKEIIENNKSLLAQADSIRELTTRTKEATLELDKLIRG